MTRLEFCPNIFVRIMLEKQFLVMGGQCVSVVYPHSNLNVETVFKSTKSILIDNTRINGSSDPDKISRIVMQHRNTLAIDSKYGL